MNIKMIGIDHNKASLDERAIFSFTKTKSMLAMDRFCEVSGVYGCVILSTCNRLEIWVNVSEDFSDSLYNILCEIKNVELAKYENVFCYRQGDEAIKHLFDLAAGLKSQILGEDQIVTQIKDALAVARGNNSTDSVLEVLFRSAITAGKCVKTEVVISRKNASLADEMVCALKKKGYSFDNKKCMVIGNGQMGNLVTSTLIKEKAEVLVTLRQYKHGKIELPEGCQGISYEDRYDNIKGCDFVISSTSSPHLTLAKGEVASKLTKPIVLIDLAVPRDIDTKCKELHDVALFDVDDFEVTVDEINRSSLQKAESIISEEMSNFYEWESAASITPNIQYLKEEVSTDVILRVKKNIKKLGIENEKAEKLEEYIEIANQKVVNKLLFALKETLTKEEFEKCIKGLENLYE